MQVTVEKNNKVKARREILTGYFFYPGSAGRFSQELLSYQHPGIFFKGLRCPVNEL